MVSRGRIVGEVTVDTGAFLGVVVIGEVVHGGVNIEVVPQVTTCVVGVVVVVAIFLFDAVLAPERVSGVGHSADVSVIAECAIDVLISGLVA